MKHPVYNLFAITLDIDWAPDFIINAVADILILNNIKCTWYVTHQSPAIDRLIYHKELFECGIHPNFLANSTHGNTTEGVLNHITAVVPGAKSVRTHALVQSSHILAQLRDMYNIETDTSLFLRETPGITPHVLNFHSGGETLLRFPYFWEDDVETYNPEKSWDIIHPKYHQQGLKIMNFHPIFIYLNSDTLDGYIKVKKIRELYQLSVQEVEPYINQNAGAGTFFKQLVAYLVQNKAKTHTISELASEWYAFQ